MPQIPVYRQQTIPQAEVGPRRIPDIGGQLAQLGQGIQAAGDAWAQKMDRDAFAWAGTAAAKEEARWDQELLERSQNAQPGAPDFTKGVLDDFQASRQELLQRAPTPRARAYLEQRLGRIELSVNSAAMQFEAKEGVANRERLTIEGNEAARSLVRSRPERFNDLLGDRLLAIDEAGLPPAVAANLKTETRESLALDAVIGMAKTDPERILALSYAEPGKSGIPALEALSQDGRDTLTRFAQAEFSRLVQAQDRQEAMEERARQQRRDEGERVATLALLRGELGLGDLQRMVANDTIDASTARTLANALKSGDTQDDPRTEFIVRTNLLSLDEDDIRDMPNLSWTTKATLIERRRQQVGGWRDTNYAQEASARIDRALNIPPGSVIAALPEETLTRRGRALTEWFDAVDALPDSQKERGAIEVAEEVISRIVVADGQQQAARLRQRLDQYKEGVGDPDKLSKAGRADYDATVERMEKRIAELEKAQ